MSEVLAFPSPDPSVQRQVVAAEVRGYLAKRKIRVSHLPSLLGNSREYWRRRITEGDVALDIDNLDQLARLLGVQMSDFLANARTPQPDDPNSPVPDYESDSSGVLIDLFSGRTLSYEAAVS